MQFDKPNLRGDESLYLNGERLSVKKCIFLLKNCDICEIVSQLTYNSIFRRMTNLSVKFLAIFLIGASLYSCQKEDDFIEPTTTPTPVVPPVVDPPVLEVGASYKALNTIFDITSVPSITLEFSKDEWNKLLNYYDMYEDNQEYVVSSFAINRAGVISAIDSIGIRLRGNTSRNRPEGDSGQPHSTSNADWHHAHFSLSFEEFRDNQEYLGLEKLNLKWFKDDPSYAREVYCYDLFERFGVWTAPQSSYCKLTVKVKGDNKAAYFGVYQMVEPVDKKYLKAREDLFGYSGGNLWKGSWGAGLRDANSSDMGVDVNTLSQSTSKTYTYSLKTNKKSLDAAKTQLSNFIKSLNSKSGSDLKVWLESNVDVDMFLKAYAVNVMVGMWDDYWLNTNNYYFYFDDNNKFTFIPYDYDNTLGTSLIIDSGTTDLLKWGNNENSPLIPKILSVTEYKTKYINYLYDLIDPSKELFDYSSSVSRIMGWQNMISSYVSNDTQEDMTIYDEPASWGNQSNYRLLSPSNNFFKIKAGSLPAKIN